MKPRILLDMDEVLADFTGAAAKIHGCTREELVGTRKQRTRCPTSRNNWLR